jgi:hypothetical protein
MMERVRKPRRETEGRTVVSSGNLDRSSYQTSTSSRFFGFSVCGEPSGFRGMKPSGFRITRAIARQDVDARRVLGSEP